MGSFKRMSELTLEEKKERFAIAYLNDDYVQSVYNFSKEFNSEITIDYVIDLLASNFWDFEWYQLYFFINNYGKEKINENKKIIKEYVYLLSSNGNTKIGRTKNPKERKKSISKMSGSAIDNFEYFEVEKSSKVESYLHKKYKNYRVNGEWFLIDTKQYADIKDYLGNIVTFKEGSIRTINPPIGKELQTDNT